MRTATQDSLLGLTEHLPCEALHDLALGIMLKVSAPAPAGPRSFDHPDSGR